MRRGRDEPVAASGDPNLRVSRGDQVFGVVEELFIELLAGAQSDVVDGDVLPGLATGESDHLLGEIANLDRLAHVQDEDLTAVPDHGRLHDELARLRDCHEETLAAPTCGSLGDEPCPGDVVAHRGPDLILEHGNLFVGGGMEEDLRALGREDRIQPPGIRNVHEMPGETQLRKAFEQFHLDAVEVVLAVVDQDEARRAGSRELAHQLGADRATGPGHQDDASEEPAADALPIQTDRIATEQILDRDRPQLADTDLRGHEVAQLRDGAERSAGPLAELDQTTHLLGCLARGRQQQQIDLLAGDDLRDRLGRSEHGDTMDLAALPTRLVVDETGRKIGPPGIPQREGCGTRSQTVEQRIHEGPSDAARSTSRTFK